MKAIGLVPKTLYFTKDFGILEMNFFKTYCQNSIFLFLDFFSYLSSFLYPLCLAKKLSQWKNRIATKRFCYVSHNLSSKIHLESPFYISGYQYIKIGGLYSLSDLRMECFDNFAGEIYTPSIIIGENVYMNFRCHIGAINKIVIGDNVLIGSNVLITDHSHGYNDKSDIFEIPINRKLYSKGPVIIEDNVWIGENVSILPNVHIGRNSIIGANSVVVKDIPAFSIAAGNPARVIKNVVNL